jgi:Sperm-tail PG-rich repeat
MGETAKVPGPGAYDDQKKVEINERGRYFISRFQSSMMSSFPHAKRSWMNPHATPRNQPRIFRKKVLFILETVHTPGPGAYQAPSEFGYYTARPSSKRMIG